MKKLIFICITAFLSMNLMADFPGDFKTARNCYNKKEYPTAQASFIKLADAAPTPKSKAQCLSWAALCLSRQKQYDQALELAQKIELKPISINCQMKIMLENKKYKELIAAFKDEDIDAWPDYLVHHGFYERGTAYRFSRDAPAAVKDLEKAIEYGVTSERFLVIAWGELGGLYLGLKEDQKALNAFRQVQIVTKDKGNWIFPNSILGITGILTRQGKYEEALTELKKYDLSKPSGSWKFLILKAYGDLYLAQGKKEEAIAQYKEAINVKGAHKSYIENLTKKLNEISGK